jgi:hypothetical protein
MSGKVAILPSEVELQTSVYGTAFITLELGTSVYKYENCHRMKRRIQHI